MTNEEQKLYWKGMHFPGILTEAERDEFIRIVNKYDRVQEPTPELQKRWGYIMGAFCACVLSISFFMMGLK